MKRIIVLLGLVLGLFIKASMSPMPIAAQGTPDYWPTHGWRSSTPEQQGMDSTRLAKTVDFLSQQTAYNIHSLLVIRNGYIVADVSFYPIKPGEKHDVASVTKSITATLVGAAIQQGYIATVTQPVLPYFTGRTIANVDANKAAMTIEDLLTMRAGLACTNEPTELTLIQMIQSEDYVQFALDLPMASAPGNQFVYCSPVTHLLQAVVQSATRQSTEDFALNSLFVPLGISDYIWPRDPQGMVHGWGDLRLTTYDMAKIGYLYLNQGQWENRQLLPRAWVSDATRAVRPGADQRTYGYLWWLSPYGYMAIGRGGQAIAVVPDKNLIIVMTGGGFTNSELATRLIPSEIVAASLSTPAPDNPEGQALLATALRQAALPPPVKREPEAPLPAVVQHIAGQPYVMEANMLGLTTLTLAFPQPDEARLDVTINSREPYQLRVGLDNVDRFAPGAWGLTAAARGKWETGNVFTMRIDELGNIFIWDMRLSLEGDSIVCEITDLTGFFPQPITIHGRKR